MRERTWMQQFHVSQSVASLCNQMTGKEERESEKEDGNNPATFCAHFLSPPSSQWRWTEKIQLKSFPFPFLYYHFSIRISSYRTLPFDFIFDPFFLRSRSPSPPLQALSASHDVTHVSPDSRSSFLPSFPFVFSSLVAKEPREAAENQGYKTWINSFHFWLSSTLSRIKFFLPFPSFLPSCVQGPGISGKENQVM